MPRPADLKSNNQIIHRFIFIIFTTHACDEVQQVSLEYGLHSADRNIALY